MRILTVVDSLNLGGTERVAQNFALGYAKFGHQSHVLSFSGGKRETILRSSGIDLHILGTDGPLPNTPFDVVHWHSFGVFRQDHYCVQRALREANPHHLALETSIFSRPCPDEGNAYFDAHLHLTRWGLAKWRSWTRWARPHPIGLVVPNLINPIDFPRPTPQKVKLWRQTYGIPDDGFLALRVGQPISAKWSHHAFDAFDHYKDNRPGYFVTIGAPTEFRQRAAKAADRRIIHLEARFDDEWLAAAYAACDVFLHSSKIGESFGMVIAEAALAERPTITLSRPLKDNGHTEVVRHDITGAIASNLNGLTDALTRLAADKSLCCRLGKAAREHVLSAYTSEAVVPKLEKLFSTGAGLDRQERRRRLISAGFDEHEDLDTLLSTQSLLGPRPSAFVRFAVWCTHHPAIYSTYRRAKSLTSRQLEGDK